MLKHRLSVEAILAALIIMGIIGLAFTAPGFATVRNLFDVLNNAAVTMIFAVGLLVVLVAGGIDISFSVVASAVQYITVLAVTALGGGNWVIGTLIAICVGIGFGLINAILIRGLNVVSIIITIATFNVVFGLMMYLTNGRSLYDLPDWLYNRVPVLTLDSGGSAATLYLPVVVLVAVALLTAFVLNRTGFGRQVYGYGSNPDAAMRSGVSSWKIHLFAYGWLGACAGIAGLMQAHLVREVVPNALYGREMDVLAAVVLGGATLGGGRGTVTGALLGVILLALVQNGMTLLGISPYSYKIVVGAIILVAITLLYYQPQKRRAAR